ncbi:hypothetical protein B0O99DRAFT_478795, partial [Bisporella sp. PMI_857]
MRYSTTLIVAAVTIGESMAGPVAHAHLHRHAQAHAKKDVVDWNALDWDAMGIDWASAYSAGLASKTASPVATPSNSPIIAAQLAATTTAAAVAAAKTTSAAAKASSTSGSVSDAVLNVKTLWSSIKGLADNVTKFGARTQVSGADVAKIGNIGNPQGSNMMKVDAVGDYQYTNTFVNTASEAITIMVWNKAYTEDDNPENALANLGAMKAPTSPSLSITLAPGEEQVVAFDEDTQAGWAQATNDIHISGSYETTWGEINYVSTGCGYDVSAIMNKYGNTYDMSITAKETDCISDMTQNLWIARNGNILDPIPVGTSDGSCYIPAGKCTVRTEMGG